MKNPHLRAKLAEVLEAVMPHMDQVQTPLVSSNFHRKRIFCSYQHASSLAEALIKVFVDIEFTGKESEERGGRGPASNSSHARLESSCEM